MRMFCAAFNVKFKCLPNAGFRKWDLPRRLCNSHTKSEALNHAQSSIVAPLSGQVEAACPSLRLRLRKQLEGTRTHGGKGCHSCNAGEKRPTAVVLLCTEEEVSRTTVEGTSNLEPRTSNLEPLTTIPYPPCYQSNQVNKGQGLWHWRALTEGAKASKGANDLWGNVTLLKICRKLSSQAQQLALVMITTMPSEREQGLNSIRTRKYGFPGSNLDN
uniref:HDC11834 n=1 Tax=Drosophila melanogaster TaxID=7227 RepID=Q6IKR1_DROME|nr:TPA_inf: HDC11834 [Drosophila melanogaster]